MAADAVHRAYKPPIPIAYSCNCTANVNMAYVTPDTSQWIAIVAVGPMNT